MPQHPGKTLAKKVGVGAKLLSKKIAKVKRDSPGLTNRQASGKAAGILKGLKRKR